MREESTASRRMNGHAKMCAEGNVLARLSGFPRARSAIPMAEMKEDDHRIVGGSGLGMKIQ
jgi:hypothetical protein